MVGLTTNWLSTKNKPRVISPCFQQASDTQVSEFINQENRVWREDVLQNYWLGFEATIVKTIPLCQTSQDDILFWPHNPNGDYMVKLGYSFVQTEFENQQPRTSESNSLKPLWQSVQNLRPCLDGGVDISFYTQLINFSPQSQ